MSQKTQQIRKFLFLVTTFWLPFIKADADRFIVFSDRPQAYYRQAIDTFLAQTGKPLEYVEGPTEQLISRLESGEHADAIIVKDLYYVARLIEKNLILERLIPHHLIQHLPTPLRDSQARWLPITYRVRSVAYTTLLSPNEVASLQTFQDLLHPQWKDSLCLRQANHPYNQTLGAQWLTDLGFSQALLFVQNLLLQAAEVTYSNDRAIISAIVNGDCRLGLVNHYYVVQMLRTQPRLPVAFKYLNDSTQGSPVNGTSLLLPKSAQNIQAAQKWAEILFNEEINYSIAQAHGDFSIRAKGKNDYIPAHWGTLSLSAVPWEEVITQFQNVTSLFETAGYR